MIKHIPKILNHKAVIMDLDIYNDRSKGFWKLYTSLLKDETYIEGIQSLIAEIDILYKNIEDKREIKKLEKEIENFENKKTIQIIQIRQNL